MAEPIGKLHVEIFLVSWTDIEMQAKKPGVLLAPDRLHRHKPARTVGRDDTCKETDDGWEAKAGDDVVHGHYQPERWLSAWKHGIAA